MIKTKNNDTPFARVIGKSFLRNPYKNHKSIPDAKNAHIQKEISLVSFNLTVLITWGSDEIVVKNAASIPNAMT